MDRLRVWLRHNRPGLAVLLGVVAVLLMRSLIPAGPWLLPFLLAGYCGVKAWGELRTGEKRTLVGLAALCALGHGVSIAIYSHYDPSLQTWWRDDHGFYKESIALAGAWREGFFPDISQKGSPPYMGTMHTGYQRALATVFYLTQDNVTAGRLLNLLCGVVLTLGSGLLSHLLFKPVEDRDGVSPAMVAGVLAALHPGHYYYGQFLLKDVYTAAWFVVATALIVQAITRRDVVACVAAVAAAYLLYTVRAYAALSLVLAVGSYAVLRIPTRTALLAGMATAVVLGMLLRYTERGAVQAAQLWHSIMELAPPQIRTVGGITKHLAMGIPRLILSPFSWIYALGDKPLYALYPAMWFLYLFVHPAMFIGLARTIRENLAASIIPLVGLLGGSFVLLLAYGGDAPRQRFYMEYIAIAFASLGWTMPRRRVFIVWYGLLLVYASGQIISVKLRGM